MKPKLHLNLKLLFILWISSRLTFPMREILRLNGEIIFIKIKLKFVTWNKIHMHWLIGKEEKKLLYDTHWLEACNQKQGIRKRIYSELCFLSNIRILSFHMNTQTVSNNNQVNHKNINFAYLLFYQINFYFFFSFLLYFKTGKINNVNILTFHTLFNLHF